MGFLDDLKKQAESLQNQQGADLATLQRNAMLAEAGAANAYRYLMDLARQLEVIKPSSHAVFRLDKRMVFDKLPLVDFKFDARRKILFDKEMLDTVGFSCTAKSGREQAVGKDFVNEIESLQARLNQGGVKHDTEQIRNPATGKLAEVKFAFIADFRISLKMLVDHERAVLKFTLNNFDGLETITCEFPAHDMGQTRLDELARWLVGQPHRFLEGAQQLRRTEPR